MFYPYLCLWILLQEKTPPGISAHKHQGKLAPGRNNPPSVKHCEGSHGEMKDHQTSRDVRMQGEPSQQAGTQHRAAGKGHSRVLHVVAREEQGQERKWRKHSTRQGFNSTGKPEPLGWKGEVEVNKRPSPSSLDEEKALPDIRRQSRPWKRAIWEDWREAPPSIRSGCSSVFTLCHYVLSCELKDQPISPGWKMSVHQPHQKHQTLGKGLVRDHYLKRSHPAWAKKDAHLWVVLLTHVLFSAERGHSRAVVHNGLWLIISFASTFGTIFLKE